MEDHDDLSLGFATGVDGISSWRNTSGLYGKIGQNIWSKNREDDLNVST
jgi:hypothetical protein